MTFRGVQYETLLLTYTSFLTTTFLPSIPYLSRWLRAHSCHAVSGLRFQAADIRQGDDHPPGRPSITHSGIRLTCHTHQPEQIYRGIEYPKSDQNSAVVWGAKHYWPWTRGRILRIPDGYSVTGRPVPHRDRRRGAWHRLPTRRYALAPAGGRICTRFIKYNVRPLDAKVTTVG